MTFSSVVGAKLPNNNAWSNAYLDDPKCKLIMNMLTNPALMAKKTLQQPNLAYRGPVRRGFVALK